jgi:type II secretory pathway component PulF
MLIIFVGGVAGFVIFAVFLPLLKIVEKLSA